MNRLHKFSGLFWKRAPFKKGSFPKESPNSKGAFYKNDIWSIATSCMLHTRLNYVTNVNVLCHTYESVQPMCVYGSLPLGACVYSRTHREAIILAEQDAVE